MEGLETDSRQLVGQLGDFGLMFHGGVWVRLGCRRLGGVLAARAVDLEQRLSFIVVGREVAVLERPCGRDAAGMGDLVKIALTQPEQR